MPRRHKLPYLDTILPAVRQNHGTTAAQKKIGHHHGKDSLFRKSGGQIRNILGRSSLPADVVDVRTLLAWLRTRKGNREIALTDDKVRVTVNRQFAAPETRIDDSVEIAIVPTGAG